MHGSQFFQLASQSTTTPRAGVRRCRGNSLLTSQIVKDSFQFITTVTIVKPIFEFHDIPKRNYLTRVNLRITS